MATARNLGGAAAQAIEALARAHRSFKVGALAKLYPDLQGTDLSRALLREQQRDGAYLRNMKVRVRSGVHRAYLGNPPLQERRARIEKVVVAERRYLAQHIAAAGNRMLREAEMSRLKVAGESGAVWVLDPSKRTHTADCLALEGRFWTWDVLDKVNPANRHHGCFAAGTEVSGPRVEGSTTRWYEGELLDVVTAGGRHLSVTPNHPVLTARGWVAAGLLDEGDDVVCGRAGEGPLGSRPDDHDVPALIEDVAVALGGLVGVSPVTVPTTAVDFHGDGQGSEVHVVRTNGSLRLAPDALNEGVNELALGRIAEQSLALDRQGAAALYLEGERSASTGRVGGLVDSVSLMDGPLLPDELAGSRRSSGGDALAAKAVTDDGPGEAVLLREALHRLAREELADDRLDVGFAAVQMAPALDARPSEARIHGRLLDPEALREEASVLASAIGTDQVLEVRRRQFAGHVYNLETAEGWYTAEGIIVHNCGCVLVSIQEARGRGMAIRRGYRTEKMRQAVELREGTRAPLWLEVEVLEESVRITIGGYWRTTRHGIQHVKLHTRAGDLPTRVVAGDVPKSLSKPLKVLTDAIADADVPAIDDAHEKLRKVALQVRPLAKRDKTLRTVDRIRAVGLNPTGERRKTGTAGGALAPVEPQGLIGPWASGNRYAWYASKRDFGDRLPQLLERMTAMDAFEVSEDADGAVVRTKPGLTADHRRMVVREMEIKVPSLRQHRIEKVGARFDDSTPLDVGPNEPRYAENDPSGYPNVTRGQLGDAGELVVQELAARFRQFGMIAPGDDNIEWPRLEGESDAGRQTVPLDLIINGFAIEMKTQSFRGLTTARAEGAGAGVKTGGPGVGPDARKRKLVEWKRRNRERKEAGLKPLKPMFVQAYVDLDNDVVHVITQLYGPKDLLFASRRVPVGVVTDLVDGKLTPGESRTSTRGAGANDPRRATTYMGSWRLRANPHRPGDLGQRHGRKELERRLMLPSRPADVVPSGRVAVEAPPKKRKPSDSRSARREKVTKGVTSRAKRDTRIAKLDAKGWSTTEIGDKVGLSQGRVSQILVGRRAKKPKGTRTDRKAGRPRR